MKLKLGLMGLVLAILFGTAIVVPPLVLGQSVSAGNYKRKVRTKVMPDYPDLAKRMNISGHVKIDATIAADGHVASTKVIGGSPLLVNAALDAVRKWRFEPAPKDTSEIIEFEFSGQSQN